MKTIISKEQIKKKFGLWKQKDIDHEYEKQFPRKPGLWKIGMTEEEFREIIKN